MQSTPYEGKRLEYQLRVDAANRCPGTYDTTPDPPEPDNRPSMTTRQLSVVRRIAAGIATLGIARAREQAHWPGLFMSDNEAPLWYRYGC